MEAPINMIGDISYLNVYGHPEKAGVVTTGHGAILEANDAAAKLLNVSFGKVMKNVPIVSYAHRSSAQVFREKLRELKTADSITTDRLVLRPRSGIAFKALVTAKVIARGRQIIVVYWELSRADVATASNILKTA